MTIKVGIVGYGNLGHGVECSIKQNKDMEIVGIFTRRNPKELTSLTKIAPIYHVDKIDEFKNKIDVLILCGGSATDLPVQTPLYATNFNVVDSFDTHKNIPEHFTKVENATKENKTLAIISSGWDPGMFSLNRLYAEAILPEGNTYTFWGKGISQGHSDAIRRIPGVKDARQYTIPIADALTKVREGKNPELTTREKHERVCYVVIEDNADKKLIEKQIKTMPNYFDEYDTTVHFITEEELIKNHSGMPHGGFVIRSGQTGLNNEHKEIIEYSLTLESNPEFTANVLIACARAAYRLKQEGQSGCRTILEIPPAYLSPHSIEDLRKNLL